MTADHWVNYFGTFLSSYGLGIMLGEKGGIFKSGCGRWCTFSVGNYFLHDIIIFPLGYKIKIHNLHVFAAQNLLVTDVFGVQ